MRFPHQTASSVVIAARCVFLLSVLPSLLLFLPLFPLRIGLFEVAPYLKKEAVKYAGYEPVTDYRAEGALQQLVAIDCAYLGAQFRQSRQSR